MQPWFAVFLPWCAVNGFFYCFKYVNRRRKYIETEVQPRSTVIFAVIAVIYRELHFCGEPWTAVEIQCINNNCFYVVRDVACVSDVFVRLSIVVCCFGFAFCLHLVLCAYCMLYLHFFGELFPSRQSISNQSKQASNVWSEQATCGSNRDGKLHPLELPSKRSDLLLEASSSRLWGTLTVMPQIQRSDLLLEAFCYAGGDILYYIMLDIVSNVRQRLVFICVGHYTIIFLKRHWISTRNHNNRYSKTRNRSATKSYRDFTVFLPCLPWFDFSLWHLPVPFNNTSGTAQEQLKSVCLRSVLKNKHNVVHVVFF